MIEIWKPIPLNERYEVSNLGNVCDTKTYRIKPTHNSNGYRFVSFGKPLARIGCKDVGVHRLVIWAFMGFLSRNTRQVNHIDGDKSNNILSNLEIVSPSENIKHAYRIGLRKTGPRTVLILTE